MLDRAIYQVIDGCRSCGSTELMDILNLGVTPLADRLLTNDTLEDPEPSCPLTLSFCPDCSLVQILETVDPEVLFCNDYPYYSSVSPALLAHFKESAEEIMARRKLGADSLIVELASNDGYQLKNYVDNGIPVLGIDPAEGPARRAIENGVNTRIEFFSQELAEQLVDEGVRADVLHANNVLAHVSDTNGFVAGIARILKDDGEAVIECPYLKDLIDHCEFDTIYHQHLCYFSVTALDKLFFRHGLHLNRVVRTSIHGGSLRLFVGKSAARDKSVTELLEAEASTGLPDAACYSDFGERIRAFRQNLRSMLAKLRSEGERVVGYGAAAKACTMMSFVGIGSDDIEYIVDMNEFKHDRYMPGNHLQIRPVETLLEELPPYVLILSWNFAEEIVAQQSEYRSAGGKFIVPIPEPRIV